MSSHMVLGKRVIFEPGTTPRQKASVLDGIEAGDEYNCYARFGNVLPRRNGEIFVCRGCASCKDKNVRAVLE